MYDVVIIGAGTAGLSAAIYAVRAGKSAVLIERESYGGQIINSPEVENYPGIKKVSGFEFATGLYEQAMSLGAELIFDTVIAIRTAGKSKFVVLKEKEIECKSVVIATGAKNRPLGIDNEKSLIGKGVSYCATCDGAFFRDKEVAVVGGGNTALEDAMFLSNYCRKVYLIHRRDEFRGEASQAAQLREKDNVEFVFDSVVTELVAEEKLVGVMIKNVKTNEERALPVEGLFVAIGQMPNNQPFANVVDIDDQGYIIAGEDCTTKTDGIFVAGDCRTKELRQLTTAAADGAIVGVKC